MNEQTLLPSRLESGSGPELAETLLSWYDWAKRDLPWRGDPDPYHLWVSEILLQQTRVESVLPYYHRFLRRFPTLADLAGASEEEVLAVWQGLGYYGRARNLWKGAREAQAKHGGCLPQSLAGLRSLPGVGEYTAAALGSIAFGLVEPALDGNVLRVTGRWFDLEDPVDSPAVRAEVRRRLRAAMPPERPGDFNQALMELGATVCLSLSPHCGACPTIAFCLARVRGTVALRPVRSTRRTPREVQVACGLAFFQGKILVRRRPSRGLLAGMWEFPTIEIPSGASTLESLRTLFLGWGLHVSPGESWMRTEHIFTHRVWKMEAFRFLCPPEENAGLPSTSPPGLRWVAPEELNGLPMGRPHRQVADLLSSESPEASPFFPLPPIPPPVLW